MRLERNLVHATKFFESSFLSTTYTRSNHHPLYNHLPVHEADAGSWDLLTFSSNTTTQDCWIHTHSRKVRGPKPCATGLKNLDQSILPLTQTATLISVVDNTPELSTPSSSTSLGFDIRALPSSVYFQNSLAHSTIH